MYKHYRIPTRPFWDHFQTGTAFLGSMLSFGGLIILALSLLTLPVENNAVQFLFKSVAAIITIGILIEGVGHLIHAYDMQKIENEGAASYYQQVTHYGKSYILRNILLAFNLIMAVTIAILGVLSVEGVILVLILAISMILMGTFGRSLFFVLVIPTTMPGAFFWKNDGFVKHARETGLAEMQQVGVVYERHHAFKMSELMQTIKENSIIDMINHIKWIFGGK